MEEFLESWNEHLPDSPITEGELKKPNEMLFRQWLINILRKLHVDTSCYENMNVESSSRLRALRFKLISTVNHFLSIAACQKSMNLNYCNLINPTFKVVFIRLRYLLNYSIFVNMIYVNNIVGCAKKMEERDALRSTKNQLRKDIEEAKIAEENCVKMYRDYEIKIPQQKSTIATLQEKEERLKKEIQNIEQEIEKVDMLYLEKKSQKTARDANIVCEQEAESIYASLESVTRQLSEQEDIIMALRFKLNENSATVEKVRSLTNKMESIQSEFAIDTAELKTLRKNLNNLESSLKIMKNNIVQLNSEIESLTQSIRSKKETIIKMNRKKEGIESTIGSKDKENLQVLKQQVAVLHKIAIKEDELLSTKQRIKDEYELIYKIASNVIKQMSVDFYVQ